jgi:hypothetical protein
VTATIKYDRPVANYIDRITATGHVTNTPYKKTSVTIHHNGGRLSLDGIYQVWRQRRASAHFQVDAKGDVGQYVDVRMYAWATGNTQGNKSSISIEQCNATLAPKWEVSETTWKSAARLAAWLHWKVLGVRPVAGKTLFRHHDWSGANTECAGPFIDAMWRTFEKECQAQYDAFTKAPPPKPDPKPVPVTPANVVAKTRSLQKLVEVTSDGKWSDLTDDRAQRMRTAALVHTYAGRLTFDVRDVQRVLDVTVDGDWGPNTQKALEKWVPQAQRVIGVEDDGVWGPGTEKAFWDFRKLAYNKF